MRDIAVDILKVAKMTASMAEEEVERLLKVFLKGTPFANKAYAVGGYVRDQVLGIPAKDLDIVVDMKDGSKKLAEYLFRAFPGKVSTPRQMRAYPIWVIAFKDDVDFNGETFGVSGAEIEIAEPQKESFPDEDSRQRVTEPGTLAEDVERRDFTVNVLLRDLTTGELKDLTGTSVSDIQHGVLRGVPGVDFGKIIRDDPLRMMRLVRFQAKYGWNVPLSVIRTVRDNAERISIVSAERIRDELIKIANVGKMAQAVRFMKTLGLLKYVIPEVDALKDTQQETGLGYHQEGDVFKHTLLVLQNSKPGVENQMAALLHDVGKPATMELVLGHIKFHGHEKAGGEIAEAIMRRMKFENKTVHMVRKMVENHMRPHNLARYDVSAKALRRFVREVGEETVDAILDLAEADSLGNLPPKDEIPKLREMIEEVQKVTPADAKPPLNGNEVMTLLGVSPGKEVGEAIQFLRDKMDELAADGKALTKEEAAKLLLEKFGGKK